MRTVALLLMLLLVALQAKLWFGDGGLMEVWELNRRLDTQVKENAQLTERNRSLDAEVQDLKQGLEAVEERARSEMGMIKEGEVFHQIIEPPATARTSQEQQSSNSQVTGR